MISREKPFRYNLKRTIFWSVGPNKLDEGGSGTANRLNGADYVWQMP